MTSKQFGEFAFLFLLLIGRRISWSSHIWFRIRGAIAPRLIDLIWFRFGVFRASRRIGMDVWFCAASGGAFSFFDFFFLFMTKFGGGGNSAAAAEGNRASFWQILVVAAIWLLLPQATGQQDNFGGSGNSAAANAGNTAGFWQVLVVAAAPIAVADVDGKILVVTTVLVVA